MYSWLLQTTPPVNGMALGFFEANRNGQRILEHGGDTQVFHSQLVLFRDQGVGLFMSFNSTGKEDAVGGVRSALFERFTDRYFPAPVPDEPTASTAIEHSRLVAGRCQSSSRSVSSTHRRSRASWSMSVTIRSAPGLQIDRSRKMPM